jgi:hypothetical protein
MHAWTRQGSAWWAVRDSWRWNAAWVFCCELVDGIAPITVFCKSQAQQLKQQCSAPETNIIALSWLSCHNVHQRFHDDRWPPYQRYAVWREDAVLIVTTFLFQFFAEASVDLFVLYFTGSR